MVVNANQYNPERRTAWFKCLSVPNCLYIYHLPLQLPGHRLLRYMCETSTFAFHEQLFSE